MATILFQAWEILSGGKRKKLDTQLKTINGNTLVGTGDLTVGGGTFSGDMDDIPDGTDYVKTENNLSDTLKGNYDDAYSHSTTVHAPSDAVSLATVKGDSDIASAISLKHSNGLDHAQNSDTGTNALTFTVNGNAVIVEGDGRLTDSRAPLDHASEHITGGGDVIADAVSSGASGLMSGSDKAKLDGIASGAEVNINADWNSSSGDSQILNKPTIPTQYTDEMAQDAVGTILTDTATIDFTYTDATPTIEASVKSNSITEAMLNVTDLTTANASTSAHGFEPKATAPASGNLNVLGILNGETARSDKLLLDNTTPTTQTWNDTALPGTSTKAARQDHKHAMHDYPTWKTGIATKNVNDASTTQTIAHGLGRTPKTVKLTGHLIYSAALSQITYGCYDGTNHAGISMCMTEGTTTATTDNIYSSTAAEIGFTAAGTTNPYSGANRQTGVVSCDATNITITWTKAGTVSSATANILWEVT